MVQENDVNSFATTLTSSNGNRAWVWTRDTHRLMYRVSNRPLSMQNVGGIDLFMVPSEVSFRARELKLDLNQFDSSGTLMNVKQRNQIPDEIFRMFDATTSGILQINTMMRSNNPITLRMERKINDISQKFTDVDKDDLENLIKVVNKVNNKTTKPVSNITETPRTHKGTQAKPIGA